MVAIKGAFKGFVKSSTPSGACAPGRGHGELGLNWAIPCLLKPQGCPSHHEPRAKGLAPCECSGGTRPCSGHQHCGHSFPSPASVSPPNTEAAQPAHRGQRQSSQCPSHHLRLSLENSQGPSPQDSARIHRPPRKPPHSRLRAPPPLRSPVSATGER